ncbi:hypothetical protein [Acanthopleuribacter pedis]|uniref:Uncharacterized protein n=1 Tax=Acanthopleuribacter pedis TaxID=442870 RepID=A0A8J7U5F4_9BACT|nr:hypothetical protein [Acanthopleuribacter pedis]MBO1319266.1 hypothetical protein [Acanthopleuribacter pedis]
MLEITIWRRNLVAWRRHAYFFPAMLGVAAWLLLIATLAETRALPLLRQQTLLPTTALMPAAAWLLMLLATALQFIEAGIHGFKDHHRWQLSLPTPPAHRLRRELADNLFRSSHLWCGAALCTTWIFSKLHPASALILLLSMPALIYLGALFGFACRLVSLVPGTAAARPVWRLLFLGPSLALLATLVGLRWASPLDPTFATLLQTAVFTALALTAQQAATPHLGRLYQDALQRDKPNHAVRKGGRFPFLTTAARRLRNPTGAFLVRSLLVRPRVWFNAVRILTAVAVTPLFPFLAESFALYGFLPHEQVTLWIAGMMLILMIDGAANPTGSEANRIVPLLTAPIGLTGILRAKLAVYLLAFVCLALLLTLCLIGFGGVATVTALGGLALALPMLLGFSVLFVYGSAFDIDPNRKHGGGLMGDIHDEAPTTVVALTLVMITGQFMLAQVALIRYLDGLWPAAAVLVLNLPLLIEACRTGPLKHRFWAPPMFRVRRRH